MKPRIVLAALASVATLAAVGGITAATASGAATTAAGAAAQTTYTPPRCYIGDLSAGFHGYQIQMGSRGYILTLTNISNHSCTLYGYPGLQLLNARMQPLPTATLWGSSAFDRDPGRSLIVLSPGETASADISYGVYGTPANSVLAYYLEVTPPNCYDHFILKIPYAPALVYLHQVRVTAMARHTPYIP
jgi:Protein of unknown function (DUF4232)